MIVVDEWIVTTSMLATTDVPCMIPYFISLKMTPRG